MNKLAFFSLLAFGCIPTVFGQDISTNGSNPVSQPVTTQPATTSTIDNGNGNGATQPPATTNTVTGGQVINNPDGTQSLVQTFYCPTPNQLIKNGLYWGTATGGWKSYSESFDGAITAFIGAQWVGINVGKMVCIYKGNLAMSFPISVQNDTLSQAPVGNLWGSDLGGYRNCHSSNVLDCPFVVKTQSVNMQQIYQSLDFFKGKPNPLQQTN